ncbi:MAG: metalloregulator ArsR/SmtB family transcription factor [Pseudomonadota bacterium]
MAPPPLDLVFGALSDPTRRAILAMLQAEGEAPVRDLAARFEISRPGVSKHLAVLRHAGLVVETKRGRENHYALERERLGEARHWLTQFWKGRLAALKTIAENMDD